MSKVLGKHYFVFNPKDNGGESLSLETTFMDNGDGILAYTNQELTLASYTRMVKILGSDLLTPEILRKLANELESCQNVIKDRLEFNPEALPYNYPKKF